MPSSLKKEYIEKINGVSASSAFLEFDIDIINHKNHRCHLNSEDGGLKSTDGGLTYHGNYRIKCIQFAPHTESMEIHS